MAAGKQIGAYQVVRELGRGGAGVVYEVVAHGDDRRLALKLLHASSTSPEALLRFGREAQLLAQIRHPSVVRVLDLKRTERGDPYIVTDLVPGEELAKLARGKPLPWRRSAKIVRELADALALLHSKGILHRDLKPHNVIMHVEGHPVLLDFGLARDGESAEERLTQTGVFMGTPAYSAPEQAEGASQVGPLADVYSLGTILYFLLSGHAPYSGSSIQILAKLVQGQPPTWPSAEDESVPRALEAVCKRAMRADLSERTHSAAALRDELDAYLRGSGQEEDEGTSRATLFFGVLALALLIGALALGWWGLRDAPAPNPPEPPPPTPTEEPEVEPEVPDEPPPSRGEPTKDGKILAKRYSTLAEAHSVRPNRTAEDLDVFYAVHHRNARDPLWTATHLSGIREPDTNARRVPPRSVFPANGGYVVTFGGQRAGKPTDYKSGQPVAWPLADAGKRPIHLSREVGGWEYNVVAPRPGSGSVVVLWESLRRYMSWRSNQGTHGFSAADESFDGYLLGLDAIEGWPPGSNKPVTAAAAHPEGSELALGTGAGGRDFKRGKNLVLRVPFPLKKEERDVDYEPPAFEYREFKFKGPTRGLAYGPSGDLWILGSEELYRWSEDGVLGPFEEIQGDASTLAVDAQGRALVASKVGVSVFSAEGKLLDQGTLLGFERLDGLATFDDGYVLAVGERTKGGGMWGVFELTDSGLLESLLSSGETDFPFASVSVGAKERHACFMRWDGKFEVWDLDALLPWVEEQEQGQPAKEEPQPAATKEPTPKKSRSKKPPDRVGRMLVTAQLQALRGKTLAEAEAGLRAETPYRAHTLDQHASAISKRPLWSDTHANVRPDPQVIPTSCFLANGRLVTASGKVSNTASGFAHPKAWSADGTEPVTLELSPIARGVRACIPDPRWPIECLLLSILQGQSLRIDVTPSLAQDPNRQDDGNKTSYRDIRSTFSKAVKQAMDGHVKPLSAVAHRHDELLLGTVFGADPPGTYALRVPLQPLPDDWFTAPPPSGRPGEYGGQEAFPDGGAQLSPVLGLEGDVKALAWGRNDTVWVLGERALVCWSEDGVERVASPRPGERWRHMAVVAGCVIVGGDQGLALFAEASPEIRNDLSGPAVSDVRALLVLPSAEQTLEGQRLLIAGTHEGHAVWKLAVLQGRNRARVRYGLSPKLRHPSPYVSLSASPDWQRVCLMHETGKFEVWDLGAIRRASTLGE